MPSVARSTALFFFMLQCLRCCLPALICALIACRVTTEALGSFGGSSMPLAATILPTDSH
ncbi:hypothetical protein PF005_g14665 [Phytophthora fragariae]|uniref:RxLR effector protein n=1 Tax=Phytophthora fragariae TaxID=53985 RepID=A0A6A4E9E5_9STRA|nr:hypothetical protein PF005_g14665 [Phytophthora fragariae]KAE9315483.1 hypothetical protein PF001_g7777 [Phytophthora fragariae]